MKLSDHFTLEEFTASSTALRLGLNNSAPAWAIDRLRVLAAGMERVRALLGGNPIHIDSAFRCPALNKAVNGSKESAHMDGYAADFICPAHGTPLDIVKVIEASGLIFDQCIQEGTWVHISFDPRARRQLMTAHFGANGTTYTKGV